EALVRVCELLRDHLPPTGTVLGRRLGEIEVLWKFEAQEILVVLYRQVERRARRRVGGARASNLCVAAADRIGPVAGLPQIDHGAEVLLRRRRLWAAAVVEDDLRFRRRSALRSLAGLEPAVGGVDDLAATRR